jgi:hypothetical protein
MEVSGKLHTLANLPLGKAPYRSWLGGWVDPFAVLCLLEKNNAQYFFPLTLYKGV